MYFRIDLDIDGFSSDVFEVFTHHGFDDTVLADEWKVEAAQGKHLLDPMTSRKSRIRDLVSTVAPYVEARGYEIEIPAQGGHRQPLHRRCLGHHLPRHHRRPGRDRRHRQLRRQGARRHRQRPARHHDGQRHRRLGRRSPSPRVALRRRGGHLPALPLRGLSPHATSLRTAPPGGSPNQPGASAARRLTRQLPDSPTDHRCRSRPPTPARRRTSAGHLRRIRLTGGCRLPVCTARLGCRTYLGSRACTWRFSVQSHRRQWRPFHWLRDPGRWMG
jgi:hypothetical protein